MNNSTYTSADAYEFARLPEDCKRKKNARKFFNSQYLEKYNQQYKEIMKKHNKRKMKEKNDDK